MAYLIFEENGAGLILLEDQNGAVTLERADGEVNQPIGYQFGYHR